MDHEKAAYDILLGRTTCFSQGGKVKQESPKTESSSDQAGNGSCVAKNK
jgi:hypothetical protein